MLSSWRSHLIKTFILCMFQAFWNQKLTMPGRRASVAQTSQRKTSYTLSLQRKELLFCDLQSVCHVSINFGCRRREAVGYSCSGMGRPLLLLYGPQASGLLPSPSPSLTCLYEHFLQLGLHELHKHLLGASPQNFLPYMLIRYVALHPRIEKVLWLHAPKASRVSKFRNSELQTSVWTYP